MILFLIDIHNILISLLEQDFQVWLLVALHVAIVQYALWLPYCFIEEQCIFFPKLQCFRDKQVEWILNV